MGSMLSEKNIFEAFFFHYKSMGAKEPRGVANLDPRGLIGRIYVGDYLTLLHTKYLNSGPCCFREEDFLSFSNCKSMGGICCHGNKSFNLICPKTLCIFSPYLIMLHMKFNHDWPTGFKDIL